MSEPNRGAPDLRGALVRFKAGDAVLPPVDELLRRLFCDELVEGRVVGEIASEAERDTYVAVDIGRIGDPVVVARSKVVLSRKGTDDVL